MGDWFDAIAPVHSVPLPHACRRIDIARGAALLVSLPRALIVRLPRAPSPRAARTPSLHLTWPSAAMDSSRKLDHGSASVFADSDEMFAEDVFAGHRGRRGRRGLRRARRGLRPGGRGLRRVGAGLRRARRGLRFGGRRLRRVTAVVVNFMDAAAAVFQRRQGCGVVVIYNMFYLPIEKQGSKETRKQEKKQTYRCPPVEAR